jgi:hypothetical protein
VDYHRRPDACAARLRARLGYSPVSLDQAQFDIEDFVDHVVGSRRLAVKVRERITGYGPGLTRIGRRLFGVLTLLGYFDSGWHYPPKVYAFLEACWSLEDFCGVRYSELATNPHWYMHTHSDELNGVLDKIRMSAGMDWFSESDSGPAVTVIREIRNLS